MSPIQKYVKSTWGEGRGIEEQLQCLGKKVTDGAACDTPAVLRGGGRGWEEEGRRRGKQAVCHLLLLSVVICWYHIEYFMFHRYLYKRLVLLSVGICRYYINYFMWYMFHRYFQEVSVTFCYSCVDRSILTDYGKLTVGHQRLRLDKHASGKKSFQTSYVSTVFWFNAFSKWIGSVSDSVKNFHDGDTELICLHVYFHSWQ